jgi:hypothetical protein
MEASSPRPGIKADQLLLGLSPFGRRQQAVIENARQHEQDEGGH